MCLLYTLDISRSLSDKSVLIFCKSHPYSSMIYSCISLSSHNRIRFLGMPDYLRSYLVNDVSTHYEPGIEQSHQRHDSQCTCYEINLNGAPWSSNTDSDTAALHARRMLLKFMESASACKWQVCASVDISSKYYSGENASYPLDVNSWILCSDNSYNSTQDKLPSSYYPNFVGSHYFSVPSSSLPPTYEDAISH